MIFDCCAVVCNLGNPVRQKKNYNPKGVIVVVVMPVIVEMPSDIPSPIPDISTEKLITTYNL